MSIVFMSENFGRAPIGVSTHYSKWMGRLKVKPGSLGAAESRPPSRG
jgi:hypothetical protein